MENGAQKTGSIPERLGDGQYRHAYGRRRGEKRKEWKGREEKQNKRTNPKQQSSAKASRKRALSTPLLLP